MKSVSSSNNPTLRRMSRTFSSFFNNANHLIMPRQRAARAWNSQRLQALGIGIASSSVCFERCFITSPRQRRRERSLLSFSFQVSHQRRPLTNALFVEAKTRIFIFSLSLFTQTTPTTTQATHDPTNTSTLETMPVPSNPDMDTPAEPLPFWYSYS